MLKKDETVDDFLNANQELAKTSIVPLYNFMTGLPTETPDDILKSVDLAVRLMEENPKAQISGFYVFVPCPGTEMFDLAIEHGFEPPESVGEWAVFSRQHLSTPWIQGYTDLLKSLLETARFVDGTRITNRLRSAFGGFFPAFIGRSLGNFYRSRWKRHVFNHRLDTAISRLFLWLFSVSQWSKK